MKILAIMGSPKGKGAGFRAISLIEQKILAADGVILSSPMNVNNVSWLMKNFMDRFAYTMHRPRFYRQKVLTVVNSGGGDTKLALPFLRYGLGGSRIVHELGIMTPPWPQTARAVAKKERIIDVAAKKLYRACLGTSLPPPTFRSYTDFLLWKKIGAVCGEYLPADYAFYQSKAEYFNTKINPIKAVAAKVLVEVMINSMKDRGPGNVSWPVTKKADNS